MTKGRAEDLAGAGVEARLATLSPAEADILERLMQGASPREIATAKYVGMATVRTQIRVILRTTDTHSQGQAIAYAYRAGWSRPCPE